MPELFSKRIFFHCNEYTPCLLPGTKRIRVFHDVLTEQGYDVSVITSKANLYGHENEKFDAPDTIYCPAISLKKKSAIYRFLSPLSFSISMLMSSHKLGNCDVVFTTSPPPLISLAGYHLAKRKHAKLIYDVRDIWPDVALEMGSFSETSFYCKLFRWIAKKMYKKADLITAVSAGKVNKLRSMLPMEQQSKVRLLENGLDENFLKQEIDKSVIEKYHINDYFTVVYTGNIGLAQGLMALLNLAETVNPDKVQFLLFGKGAEKEELEKYVQQKEMKHVHFEGVVSEKMIFSILNYAKLAYIPLVNSNLKDSIPTKTYEALGVGCPVLMAAEGDAPKIVEECKLGVCVSPDHINELPNVFQTLYENYEKIIKNKEYAKKVIIEKHSRQKVALELDRMLKELL